MKYALYILTAARIYRKSATNAEAQDIANYILHSALPYLVIIVREFYCGNFTVTR